VSVAICAREPAPLEETAQRLRSQAAAGQRVHAKALDVADERAVHELVAELGGVDAAICCAGIHGPIGPFESADWGAWEAAVRTNLCGTALVCRAVIPGMRERGWGKIVAISGGGATQPRPRFSAYAASKAAVVRLVETLSVELAGSGIDVNAIAPGALNTRLLDHVLAAGPVAVGEDQYALALQQRASGGFPLAEAAEAVAFLASPASDGITGRLIAARWDDWRRLPSLRDRLAASDMFTLRRITPEDRGWPA